MILRTAAHSLRSILAAEGLIGHWLFPGMYSILSCLAEVSAGLWLVSGCCRYATTDTHSS